MIGRNMSREPCPTPPGTSPCSSRQLLLFFSVFCPASPYKILRMRSTKFFFFFFFVFVFDLLLQVFSFGKP